MKISPSRLPRQLGVVLAAITPWLAMSALADNHRAEVTAREITRTIVTADGEPVKYPGTGKAEVTARIVELPPGAETGWHYHPIPVYGYVLRGTLEVERRNGEVDTYSRGEVIVEAVETPHTGRNRGTEPVELVAFYTGVQGTPDSVALRKTPGGSTEH